MATETKSSVVKVKPNNQFGSSSSKPRIESSSLIKKKVVQTSSKPSVDAKGKSAITVSKTEVKGKTTSSSSKIITKTETKTRVKKVFSLAGQKYDVPEEREPLRLFYESLSKQIPSSEMAEFWLWTRYENFVGNLLGEQNKDLRLGSRQSKAIDKAFTGQKAYIYIKSRAE